MPSSPRPVQRISGTAELLDAIPYLLGFHPDESLVLIGMRGATIVVTARLDLVDTGRPGLVEQSLAAMYRGGADRFLAAVVDNRCHPPRPERAAGDWPWADAIGCVDEAVQQLGAELAEALLVSRGRWWSYVGAATGCWPRDGYPLAGSPSAFAATSTVMGRVALPSREALARTLEPLPATRRALLVPLIADAENDTVAADLEQRLDLHHRGLVRDLLRGARGSAAVRWSPPEDAIAARLVAALRHIAVRDEVWTALDSRRVDGRPLWAELARRSPAPYDAAPMFLFAWASWRDGNGALAGMAAERALESDPAYSAADLLLAALNQAVDPGTFPRLAETRSSGSVRDRPRRERRAAAARTPR